MLHQLSYGTSFADEFQLSDHRPVFAQFEIKCAASDGRNTTEVMNAEHIAFLEYKKKFKDGSVVTLSDRACIEKRSCGCVIM